MLTKRELHLGKPQNWQDRNDGKLLELFSTNSGCVEIRATCLTSAADRFHFWAVFGQCKKGVCLWFDKAELMQDIACDETLRSGFVRYESAKTLAQLEPAEIPFTKREQYADEREFRVMKTYSSSNPGMDGFKFSAASLKRVYLNPWLNPAEVKQEKQRLAQLLQSDLDHVEIRQNRALKNLGWIEAAKQALAASR